MINLRSTTPSPQSTQSDGQGANRSLAFASFAAHDSILGNLGQPLGEDIEQEDEDYDKSLQKEDHGAGPSTAAAVEGEVNLASGV